MAGIPETPDLLARAAVAAWGPARGPAAGDDGAAAARARRRGAVQSLVGIAIGGAVAWWWRPLPGAAIAGVALLVGLLALASPLRAFAALSRFFERLGRLVGGAVTWLLMGVLYYLVFLPLGLALRARGRLRLTTGFDARQASYWTPTGRRRPLADYRRQF